MTDFVCHILPQPQPTHIQTPSSFTHAHPKNHGLSLMGT